MGNTFVDFETHLDAETLNKFEDDVKQLTVYNAVGDTAGSFMYYEISDPAFEAELKIGYTFVMIPDVSSQGTNNKIMAIRHNGYGDPLYWNHPNVTPSIGGAYARVNNDQYLVAGRPYIIKCFAKMQSNWQFIITEMYQPVIASSNVFGTAKMWVSGTTLNISTN